jgi:predicted permease
MIARFLTFWRAFWRRGDWERDLADELAEHVELRALDLERRGIPPAEARRRARIELGAAESHKEECRSSMGLRIIDEFRQDLRYAIRVLRRSPGFTAVAALSLALGIGANTVVFGVMNALVLRPLPVPSPSQVYFVQRSNQSNLSFPNYRDLRDRSTTFTGMAASRIAPLSLEGDDGSRRVWSYLVSGNYFEMLGIQPAVGRFFGSDTDRARGASPYAVLSYACWRQRFGGDPRVIGRSVRINTLPFTVVGVAPRGFQGTEVFYWPDVWLPISMQAQVEGNSWLDERGSFNSWVVGRLKPEITPYQAEADLNAIAASLAREYPSVNEGLRIRLSRPGLVGDVLRGPVRAFMLGVLALAGLVLLAACANLANLLAARAADRHRELAIRQSIGAGRGRILRQLLTESVMLGAMGGVAGCALAVVLLRLLSGYRPPVDFPVAFALEPDPRVLAFAAAVSLLSGILFGIAPARQAWRSDPNRALKGGAAPVGRRWAFRDLLLAAQVAVCCTLVLGCLVAFRGLSSALAMPLGFERRGAAVAGYDLGLAKYDRAKGAAFQRRSLEAAASLPGVTAAAFADSLPLSLNQSNRTVFREDAADFRLTRGISAGYYEVSPGYFRAAGTRLIGGREFDWRDDAGDPAVAIVNETFARVVTGSRDAVGRRFLHGRNRPVEIVGVVEDGKYETLTEQPTPAVFLPAMQEYSGTTVLIARSSTLPETQLAMQLRRVVTGLDASLPVYDCGSVEQILEFAFVPARAATVALGAFGVLAMMLAVTGIYGMASYAVSRRVREIGIRVAVGAAPRQALGFVFSRILWMLAAGSGAGLALGIAGGRALGSIVYQATPRDPVVLIAVPVAMALIGLASVLGPARKVVSVDPLQALRAE